MKDEEQKITYLKNQTQNVYLKDIIDKHNLKNNQYIGELLNVIASGVSTLTNPRKLSDTFRSIKKVNLSPLTIDDYITYMEESFILNKTKRYDVKGRKYIDTPYKLYFEGIGLRNARLDFRQVKKLI